MADSLPSILYRFPLSVFSGALKAGIAILPILEIKRQRPRAIRINFESPSWEGTEERLELRPVQC